MAAINASDPIFRFRIANTTNVYCTRINTYTHTVIISSFTSCTAYLSGRTREKLIKSFEDR